MKKYGVKAGCFLAVLLFAMPAVAQTPVIQSVLGAADYSPRIASGVWVAIFGTNLAPAVASNEVLPVPIQLGNVSATLTGGLTTYPVPLRYVSSGQINGLIPSGLGSGYYTLTVTTPTGTSVPYQVQLSMFAPAIYTQNAAGTGPALVFDPNFHAVTQVSNGPLVLYASGLGVTNPAGTAAGGNLSEPLNRTVYTPFVLIGGVPAQVGFSGLAPGLPGIYQLNVTPSATTAPSDNTLSVEFLGLTTTVNSAITTVPVAGGSNTAKVTGTITPTYPLNSTTLNYSPLLTAASLDVAFDVLPSAKAFKLVASCPGSTLTIAFNPGAGTWQATGNVPPAAERIGDFTNATNSQGSFILIYNFQYGGDVPFAGNFIPQSLLDKVATQALSGIPLPNSTGSSNFVVQGAIPASGHFAIDGADNSSLANFGNFAFVGGPGAGGELYRTNTCRLTVDGLLVSSSMVTFQ